MSANVEYTSHDGESQNHSKWPQCFGERRKLCITLCIYVKTIVRKLECTQTIKRLFWKGL